MQRSGVRPIAVIKPDTLITADADEQPVALVPGPFQIIEVAAVEQIERAGYETYSLLVVLSAEVVEIVQADKHAATILQNLVARTAYNGHNIETGQWPPAFIRRFFLMPMRTSRKRRSLSERLARWNSIV